MNHPRACPRCLRRAWLLGALAPYIERSLGAGASSKISSVLGLEDAHLAEAMAAEKASEILAQVDALTESRLDEQLQAAFCWATCRHDDYYPDSLRDAPAAPSALICRGDPAHLIGFEPREAVSIIGSRRASAYGRAIARQLGHECAGRGLMVLSGLAFGIDSCAHRGALESGVSIAVLGCGPDIAYPAAHRSLWRHICDSGLVVSELPPGSSPWHWTFPARNRIVAALGGMTIVVEAAERSGSMVTANFAAASGRSVGAVPGPVSSPLSSGPNRLLTGGACVVRDVEDVLRALSGDSHIRGRSQAAS